MGVTCTGPVVGVAGGVRGRTVPRVRRVRRAAACNVGAEMFVPWNRALLLSDKGDRMLIVRSGRPRADGKGFR